MSGKITDEQYQEKKEQGFDEDKFNKLISIELLLLHVLQHYNEEVKEYLAEYNMHTFDSKDKLKGIGNRIEELVGKINPAFKNEIKNKLNFFEDYGEFLKVIEEFKNK